MNKRIAIICEPSFMLYHVGVRNYILSIARLLGGVANVDFVSFYRTPTGGLRWYRLVPKAPAQLWEHSSKRETMLFGSPADVLAALPKMLSSKEKDVEIEFYKTCIGSDLGVENYDIGIITNPWLVSFEKRLPVKRLVGIVYDIVPNHYVFSRDDKPFDFATRHCQGFQYYREHCDSVIAISSQVASSFQEMFCRSGEKVWGLPPLCPPSYHRIPIAGNDRNRQVVLASPFDLRKGLKVMPGILNAASAHIDNVCIYGSVRCSHADAQAFFKELKVKSIQWYPNAPSTITHRIFRESKALLFPSFDEGLGLPILEAQAHGCRTMVREKRPMSDLVGPGARFVTENDALDGATLAEMLQEPFDHSGLQRWTAQEFCPSKVLGVLFDAMGWKNEIKYAAKGNELLVA